MKVYLINLDRAPDRLLFMSKAFEEAGITFERIPATDGRKLSKEQIDRLLSGESYWGPLTPGEVGCFLSHRKCWQAIAEGEEEFGAVFEDDMLLGKGAGKIFSETSWIPSSADIVKLETAGSRVFVDTEMDGRVGAREVRRLRSSHYCTGAYILSRNAAQRLLEESKTFSEPVDDVLFSPQAVYRSSFILYQMLPAVSMQRSRNIGNPEDAGLPSSIEGREQKKRKRLSFGERARLVALKETQSAVNKLLTLVGKRERLVVEFK